MEEKSIPLLEVPWIVVRNIRRTEESALPSQSGEQSSVEELKKSGAAEAANKHGMRDLQKALLIATPKLDSINE